MLSFHSSSLKVRHTSCSCKHKFLFHHQHHFIRSFFSRLHLACFLLCSPAFPSGLKLCCQDRRGRCSHAKWRGQTKSRNLELWQEMNDEVELDCSVWVPAHQPGPLVKLPMKKLGWTEPIQSPDENIYSYTYKYLLLLSYKPPTLPSLHTDIPYYVLNQFK